jgi:hypothetical protein
MPPTGELWCGGSQAPYRRESQGLRISENRQGARSVVAGAGALPVLLVACEQSCIHHLWRRPTMLQCIRVCEIKAD